jgi:hypothetical protein
MALKAYHFLFIETLNDEQRRRLIPKWMGRAIKALLAIPPRQWKAVVAASLPELGGPMISLPAVYRMTTGHTEARAVTKTSRKKSPWNFNSLSIPGVRWRVGPANSRRCGGPERAEGCDLGGFVFGDPSFRTGLKHKSMETCSPWGETKVY